MQRFPSAMTVQNCSVGPLAPAIELPLASLATCSLCLVGLLCNALTFALTLGRHSKNRFHTLFIANLAAADLLVGLVCPLQWISYFRLAPSCGFRQAVRLVFEASQTLQVVSVSAISIDRASVALWPVRYYKRDHRVAPWAIILGLWCFTLFFHLGLFLALARGGQNAVEHSDWEHYTSTLVLTMMGTEFLLPLAALLASNIIINVKVSHGHSLRRSLPPSVSKSAGSENPEPLVPSNAALRPLLNTRRLSSPEPTPLLRQIPKDRRASSVALAAQSLRDFRRRRMSGSESDEFIRHVFNKKQHRTLKILIVLVMIFVLCRLPRAIFLLLLRLKVSRALSLAASECAIFYLNLLLQLNATLDPIVYSFWGNRLYKRRVRTFLSRCMFQVRTHCWRRAKATWV